MHYILGTEVTVKAPVQSGSIDSLQPIGAQNPLAARGSISSCGPFKPGTVYKLHNIKKNVEGLLEYSFVTEDSVLETFVFPDATHADEAIAKALGETLPDYESLHWNRCG
jgi:hypothetical protein